MERARCKQCGYQDFKILLFEERERVLCKMCGKELIIEKPKRAHDNVITGLNIIAENLKRYEEIKRKQKE